MLETTKDITLFTIKFLLNRDVLPPLITIFASFLIARSIFVKSATVQIEFSMTQKIENYLNCIADINSNENDIVLAKYKLLTALDLYYKYYTKKYLDKKIVNENNLMYKGIIDENMDIITENKAIFNNIYKYITEHKIYERR
ncbi:hypothetical protein [Helicobacter sp. T3_23-1056]